MRPFAFSLRLYALSTLLGVGSAAPSAQQTLRASVDALGAGGNFTSRTSTVSLDGRVVAFVSGADDLVAVDSNFSNDIFVRDFDAGTTTRISVSSGGGQANHHSDGPQISADGRFVYFSSNASNLVSGDTNSREDVFVHDRVAHTTSRVSLTSAGDEVDGPSYQPSISSDTRYLAFTAAAPNLPPGDGAWHIYLRDQALGTTELISVDSAGNPADAGCTVAQVSNDGRYVVFSSIATNLVPNDTNSAQDLFIRDRATGTTTRLSVTSDGQQTGAGGSSVYAGGISDDGRLVPFWSSAGNLVADDTNGYPDVFLHDRQTAATTRLSADVNGVQGNFPSHNPSITADGRFVAFQSWASNLVPGDNGSYHDIFLRDLANGSIRRISLDMAGLDPDLHSYFPSITDDGRYVVFESSATDLVAGDVNGWQDIFVTGPLSHYPAPDVRVNGLDGPVSVAQGTPVTVTIALDAGDLTGQIFDWWIWAETSAGDVWLLANFNWFVSAVPLPFLQAWPLNFPAFPIVNGATILPPGEYKIHMALDDPNFVLEGTYQDTVELTIF